MAGPRHENCRCYSLNTRTNTHICCATIFDYLRKENPDAVEYLKARNKKRCTPDLKIKHICKYHWPQATHNVDYNGKQVDEESELENITEKKEAA